ncbi:uncharacterized protein K452DRAFT_326256 [Aplosporella prunicola CBS 121167]|uniref:Saponin hydrolase n=1 Tax=Aplosporella prunicola CBS 121167 TaxID=1176127 RepID=A0A6A6BG22_9PEZI|nr:uncharacterized protein K452DRAFT_326256 [Aplosporella prunicola CBS 121167]KAF2143110.1 hypothetical protein K452DRAFT_326256 [Aplosporella prunicola CBS 121167]
MLFAAAVVLLGTTALAIPARHTATVPTPPDPEPIVVTELPLPPVAPNYDEGSCTAQINSRGTGCISKSLAVDSKMQSGGFLPDGKHVAAFVSFAGAPAGPDPASIYTGKQVIIVKADNTTFSNGDAWKCITCGAPEDNAVGLSETWDYPQAFTDGKRLLAGANIIDCGAELASDDCTPEKTHIYPIRWNTNPDGSGKGGSIRELRLHPDNVHIVFSSEVEENGMYSEYGYFAKLELNESPKSGIPLAPRYDLASVTVLYDPKAKQPVSVDGDQLFVNPDAVMVGELRGFTGTGNEITYVGYPAESSNIDIFAADLTTGKVRRLTSHPEYADPIDVSPVDDWMVVMDTRGSNRQMFMAGMRGIPPITDLITTSATSSTRNNGQRRFFQPYLLDRYGDRGEYFGQRINAGGDDKPGGISDREWNGMADPRWSPDGTHIVYWQALTVSPACGGDNPLPCEDSTEPGGRTARLMMAHLTSRKPQPNKTFMPISDTVPWGTPYEPGVTLPPRPSPSPGNYTLKGKSHGSAQIVLTGNSDKDTLSSVSVTYNNFSDDGINVLQGWENVTVKIPKPTLNHLDWYSDLVRTGETNSIKKTSPDGFHLDIDVLTNMFDANGTLSTTIDGHTYEQPANGA